MGAITDLLTDRVSLPVLIVAGLLLLYVHHHTKGPLDGDAPLYKGSLPFMGAALEANSGLFKLLIGLKKKLGTVFSVYIMGDRMLVVTDHESAVRQVFLQSAIFSSPDFIKGIDVKLFKYTKILIDNHWFVSKNLLHGIVALLKSNDDMENIMRVLRTVYRESLSASAPKPVFAETETTVELYRTLRTLMYNASSISLFGEEFPADGLLEDFLLYEDHVMQFLKGVPWFMNKGYNARERILKKLAEFFEDPNRLANGQPLLKAIAAEFQAVDLEFTPTDMASYFLSIMFASKSNSVPLAFWMTGLVISKPELKDNIYRIIKDNYDYDNNTIDWDAISANPLIVACWKETTRLCSSTAVGRLVMNDTKLKVGSDVYKVHAGQTAMVMGSLIHWDENIYPDPMEYIPERFLKGSNSKYYNESVSEMKYTLIPFGGGAHLCPGRAVAFAEAVCQLVYILWFFEVEIVGQPLRFGVEERFSSGAVKPSDEFNVKFTRRVEAPTPIN
ncbi:cytochrome P450 [Dipodascopsis tothii]|uniref:cytochrome P450 n=1 Tax=Dipodascopsis tothii TaxID=44089 RepID=UPI0034CDEA7E